MNGLNLRLILVFVGKFQLGYEILINLNWIIFCNKWSNLILSVSTMILTHVLHVSSWFIYLFFNFSFKKINFVTCQMMILSRGSDNVTCHCWDKCHVKKFNLVFVFVICLNPVLIFLNWSNFIHLQIKTKFNFYIVL